MLAIVTIGGGPTCPETIKAGWTPEVMNTATGKRSMVLSAACHGCTIGAAAFDYRGLVLAEGCRAVENSWCSDFMAVAW
jgi:hypothetical protein